MSDSPLTDFANATLTFKAATGTGTTDPITGNRIVTQAEIVLTAVLNKTSDRAADRPTPAPGLDQSAVYLEGRAIDPLELPRNVGPWAVGTWAGYRGRFYLLTPAPDSWGASAIVGTKLKGWFQIG